MAIQPLESELLRLLGGDLKAQIVARYCGFDGFGGTTLHQVGAEFGVTAERVRQIVGEVVRGRAHSVHPMPTLLAAIAFLAGRPPGPAGDLERQLQSAGLSSLPFRIEGIIRAAELIGQTVPFSLTETQRSRLVHSLSAQSLDSIVRVARRAIERRGLTTVEEVSRELLDTAPEAAGSRLIADVLTGADDLCWLDQSLDWFWLPSVARNPVLRRIRKILSVANPIRFSELYTGVDREYRLQRDAPPPAVLQELCRQIPGLKVSGECVEAHPKIDPHEVLGQLEQAIVDVLLEHGGLMRRADLAAVCVQSGLNRATFYSTLTHSPVTTPFPGGLVGLIGMEVSRNAVPSLAPKHRSTYLHPKARTHTISLRRLMESRFTVVRRRAASAIRLPVSREGRSASWRAVPD